jgi:hypothetical protein
MGWRILKTKFVNENSSVTLSIPWTLTGRLDDTTNKLKFGIISVLQTKKIIHNSWFFNNNDAFHITYLILIKDSNSYIITPSM